jgi:hypothetical protein
MAKLKITRTDGAVSEHQITPSIEFAFENHAKMGFHKAFREKESQSDVYFLAWECLRRSCEGTGETIKPFGSAFLDTLVKVEVLDDDDPK